MKRIIEEYWQLAVALLVIVITIFVMCCSCSTPREIEHVYHHDTVYSNSVVHDSVDRWHTHYEFVKGDTLHMIDTFWRDRWHVAHDTAYKTVVDVQTRDVEKVVEKKVYVWWPCWVVLGIAIALGLWWLVEHTINNIAKKEGEQ
jgi:hypothetical protein